MGEMNDGDILTVARVMLDSHGEGALATARFRAEDNAVRGHAAAAEFWRRTADALRGLLGEAATATAC